MNELRRHRIDEVAKVLDLNRYRISRILAGTNPTIAPGSEGEEAMWRNVAAELVNRLDDIDRTATAART